MNQGNGNYRLWVKEEDEVRRSCESERKRRVSPEKRGRMPPHMVESKDEKEPLKYGQVECVRAWIQIMKQMLNDSDADITKIIWIFVELLKTVIYG